MRKGLIFMLALLFSVAGTLRADEGMWLPSLIQKLNIEEMNAMGCELTAEQIYNINQSSLKDAIVALDHGSCTGELISSEGLLLTNHHCGFGEIQAHSSVKNDYLRDGFWAMSRDEELANPGKTASFLISIEEVTDKVLADVTDEMDETARQKTIKKIAGQLEADATKDTHYEAKVRSMFESNRYYLFIYETFRDIRLVGAPPKSIGKFGGDTDNWMWPRHTGDFTIFRVYCGPDGKPASYSEDNVPYQPKHHLPISLKGISKGDFAMIMGYPGSTTRYRTSFGVKYTMEVTNEARRVVREEKLAIIDKYMDSSQKARIQYSSKHARSSNYYKYSIGQNKGLKALNVIGKKEAIEADFTNWVNQDEARKNKYGNALSLIEEAYTSRDEKIAYEYIREAMLRGPEIFMFASRAKGLYMALKNGDEKALQHATDRIRHGMDNFYKDYDAATDQKLVAKLSEIYNRDVVNKYHPQFFEEVKGKYKGDFDKYAMRMFAKSVFTSKDKLEAFLEKPSTKVLDKDPAYQASLEIFNTLDDINADMQAFGAKINEGRRLFVAGLREMNPEKAAYPDANSTMRLTYGTVGDYKPRDGVQYDYFTTLKGYIEKEIPNDNEFHVPPKLKELYQANDFGRYADKDGTLHTCFTTNNDITGGNSGSPVINGKGELIGCAFDGNWEAMSGDIAFEPELQKCICVDIRFVLWVVDKFAGASHLVDEMTIVE